MHLMLASVNATNSNLLQRLPTKRDISSLGQLLACLEINTHSFRSAGANTLSHVKDWSVCNFCIKRRALSKMGAYKLYTSYTALMHDKTLRFVFAAVSNIILFGLKVS